jgi:hypothetical protein
MITAAKWIVCLLLGIAGGAAMGWAVTEVLAWGVRL